MSIFMLGGWSACVEALSMEDSLCQILRETNRKEHACKYAVTMEAFTC